MRLPNARFPSSEAFDCPVRTRRWRCRQCRCSAIAARTRERLFLAPRSGCNGGCGALADEGGIEVILDGGKRISASVAGRDPTTDIALLRTEEAVGSAVQFDLSSVAVGSLVTVIGAQDGGPVAAIGGVAIAGPGWRSLRGGAINTRIELDLSLRRIAEGGVVLNLTDARLVWLSLDQGAVCS